MPIAIIDAHRELESVARTFLEKTGARAQARALLDATDESLPSFWKEIAGDGLARPPSPRGLRRRRLRPARARRRPAGARTRASRPGRSCRR